MVKKLFFNADLVKAIFADRHLVTTFNIKLENGMRYPDNYLEITKRS
jgi:hypothetical protein